MIERLRAVGRHLAHSPWWQLLVGGAILALLFPSRLAGAIGISIVAGGIGVGIAVLWPRLPEWLRTPSDALATTVVLTIVIMMGVSTFWDTLTVSPDWQMGDWGPQRAVLAHAMPSLPGRPLAMSKDSRL